MGFGIEYNPLYLFTFARKNELFGDYPVIGLKGDTIEETDWQDADIIKLGEKTLKTGLSISKLSFAISREFLFIRVNLKRRISKDYGLSIFLIGYSDKTPFADMPKIRLDVNNGSVLVRDKKRRVLAKDIEFISNENSLTCSVPLSILGDPNKILANVRTKRQKLFGKKSYIHKKFRQYLF